MLLETAAKSELNALKTAKNNWRSSKNHRKQNDW